MKSIFSFIVFISFFQIINAQKLNKKPEIKIHTKFLLELFPKDSTRFDYKIVNKEYFNKNINMDSTSTILNENLESNQVQGVFTTSNFGNNQNTILIIKTGSDTPINYELFIKKKRKFKKTSTIAINTIPSIEIWNEQITSLKIFDFIKLPIEKLTPDIKIDTLCHSKYDIYKGNKLFNEQLPLILDIVSKERKKTEIEIIKKYENSITSKPKSSWGLLDNLLIATKDGKYIDGYINRKKIGKPLAFELIECPFLVKETVYYFTKRKKDIKLVMLSWKLRWSNGWQSQNYSEIYSNFKQKRLFLINTLKKYMEIDTNLHPNHSSELYETIWFKKKDVLAKLSILIDKKENYYSIELYVYKKD